MSLTTVAPINCCTTDVDDAHTMHTLPESACGAKNAACSARADDSAVSDVRDICAMLVMVRGWVGGWIVIGG